MANGNFAGGDGSLANPFLIEDAHDLDAVRNGLDKHYKLIKDIDLDVHPYNEGEGWKSIGNSENRFRGTLDGDNHIIKNLCIIKTINNVVGIGLIGATIGAEIKNIGVENVDITSSRNVTGGLVGYADESTIISNSYSTGNIKSSLDNVGGLIGQLRGSTVTDSYSTCNVNGRNEVGSLIGYIYYYSTVVNSYSTGVVNGSGRVGGFTAVLRNSTITNSFWDIETSGITQSAGGIGLTTQQMQTAQTFIDASWDKELNGEGNPVWILKDGKYPKLWFEKEIIPNKYLFQCSNNVMTPSEEGLSKIGNMPATNQMFDDYGTDDLSDIIGKVDKNFEMKYKEDLEDRKLYRYKLVGFKDICILRNVKETIIDTDIDIGGK
jgi:hypothetical protein